MKIKTKGWATRLIMPFIVILILMMCAAGLGAVWSEDRDVNEFMEKLFISGFIIVIPLCGLIVGLTVKDKMNPDDDESQY